MIARPIFTVTLRPEPRVAEPIVALRAFLKRALRGYGLRCVAISKVACPAPAPADAGGAE